MFVLVTSFPRDELNTVVRSNQLKTNSATTSYMGEQHLIAFHIQFPNLGEDEEYC